MILKCMFQHLLCILVLYYMGMFSRIPQYVKYIKDSPSCLSCVIRCDCYSEGSIAGVLHADPGASAPCGHLARRHGGSAAAPAFCDCLLWC